MKRVSCEWKFHTYSQYKDLQSPIETFIGSYLGEKNQLIAMALTEAINNAFIHGKKNLEGPGAIRLRIAVSQGRRVIIRIKDPGPGFPVQKVLRELEHQDLGTVLLNESGRGILIIKETADYFTYNSLGNELLFSISLSDKLSNPPSSSPTDIEYLVGGGLSEVLEKHSILLNSLDSIKVGVAITHFTQGIDKVIYVNEGLCKITGYSQREIKERGLALLNGENTNRLVLCKIKKACQKKERFVGRLLGYKGNGAANWYQVRMEPTGNKYFTWLIEDIDTLIEKEDHLKRSMYLAEQTQKSILPPPLADENIQITGYYKSAENISGDFYAWYKVDEHRYGVIILDVMGHGVPTSLVCMSISSLLEGLIKRQVSPAKVMNDLNHHMCRLYLKKNRDISYYFTAIYMLIDTKKKTIDYVNAGHPPAMLINNSSVQWIKANNIPVGMFEEINYRKSRILYSDIDKILLYTDGLLDVIPGSNLIAKLGGLEEILKKPDYYRDAKEIISILEQKHLANSKNKDDICMVEITNLLGRDNYAN